MKKAILVLEDNTVFYGDGFGALGSYQGELVFNTAMTGYMEALTDPSYAGQILTFAYPLIGNYGVSLSWGESNKVHPVAVVVSELCDTAYHREAQTTVDALLQKQGRGGISGIDTRMLIRKIRTQGTAIAVLFLYENTPVDLVKQVTRKSAETFNPKGKIAVALIDYGFKGNIARELAVRGCKVTVFSATVPAAEILKRRPRGIILSNGPGDPAMCIYAHKIIQGLLKTNLPIFGICLGQQLLALAAGGKTYKLKFGHRGINHPVMDLETGRAFLTSQNHGYTVDPASLPADWQVTHVNLNDNTVEGLRHKRKPILSVQFHPEAHPGPHDTRFLFDKFLAML